MLSTKSKFQTVDEYIGTFPKDVKVILEKVRLTIRRAAPGAGERISYQIPTFTLHGNLVHFAAWKHHVGFYPTSKATETFKKELSPYEVSKGSVRFPIDKPLPLSLISKIVKFRVKENLQRMKKKK